MDWAHPGLRGCEIPIGRKKRTVNTHRKEWSQFNAEAAYANSIFRTAIGDSEGAISELEHTLEWNPNYAPAILSMGSVEYQRGRRAKGRKLFLSLLSLPEDTPDLCEIIDEAGSFLIQIKEYEDGLELFRTAVARFPSVPVFHQGIGCCAGHEGLHDEAIKASERALEIGPDNQEFVNDLGWSLFMAGRLQEAKKMLERAVVMGPSDKLARENLRICTTEISKRHKKKSNT